LSAGEFAGYLTEKAAGELGLVPGIPVGSGVIDAYAGWIGTVGAAVDSKTKQADMTENDINQVFSRLAAVAGTSTCHLVMSPTPIFVPGVWGPYKNIILPGQWMAEGGQSATGHLLKHVVETHPTFNEANLEASARGVSIYEYLNKNLREEQLAQNLPHLSVLAKHFFYYGDVFGNRSPLSNPAMSGCVIGLTSDVSVNSLALHYYGCMEFIAFQTRQIIDSMRSKGHTIDSIFMSGSQCQNDILMHLFATICRIPVVIPKYINAAVVHGAAILGAKAASVNEKGLTEDLWVIMNRMSKPGRCVYPGEGPIELKLLETKYKIFLRQCFDQLEFRKMVDLSLKEL
jgi:D-ribulokinase